MPTALSPLPLNPPEVWTKPTYSNTHGGKTYKPTHPDLFKVEFTPPVSGSGEEEYSSRLVAARDFEPNETITRLTNISLAPEKAYSSVQFGSGQRDHLELNSDLLFMNHSCSPTAEIRLPTNRPHEWEVRATSKGLKEGEAITFFYPSTEWDMAVGFDCSCGSDNCLGKIKGAKHISIADLEERSYINDHILRLKEAS
ncbi:uncharacterized protein I303_107309 [Kwoniella dejecticola CBS 10117]|uniref:Post-SET domain-containing protein n=1 Tax=Kwoniella dejecticola CBS 10117 TaxID=1296121 RepID=A0A1A5ZZB1_9TREE|nr:uncharacterized protein I303_06713 [Kwoniella dejecticola CBS 10117]OBR83154.1 hypothetical protein I303_06713 [Kwoniella dejecticola CBS 10117]